MENLRSPKEKGKYMQRFNTPWVAMDNEKNGWCRQQNACLHRALIFHTREKASITAQTIMQTQNYSTKENCK